MAKKKLLLIGWDAADWKIIGPLMAKGHMPALKKVIDNGVYGNMSTMNPPYSPMLWSSVATGKTPDKHGVLGFIELLPDLKGVRPVTARSRKSRAIWNILHNQGYRSNLAGWWPSYPAEPINGVVISDKFQKVSNDPAKKSPLPEDAIHPKEVIKDYRSLRMFPHEITKEHILPFIPRANEIDQEKNALLKAFSRVMAHNVSVHNAATRQLRTTEWDFMAVYSDLIDHFCHAFMNYHPPKMNGIGQKDYDIFNQTVTNSYRFQDMMLDRTLKLIDKDTTVIIMSDHGYESGSRRILEMPNVQAAPALEHRQFGMFAAMGPNIKKNTKVFGLNLIDIAPTALHFFDLPIGEDMDGKPILEMFKKTDKPKYIESWENVEGDFGELPENSDSSEFSDQETMEQLIELGYIERPDEKIEVAILKTKCDLKHNLARVHLGKKDYDKAKEILLELIEEKDPIDTAPFYADLLTIAIKFKNFDDAEAYIKKIRSSNTKVKFNLFFQEASILSGKEFLTRKSGLK
jgi:predicted AlkP superfamily phosphohydrolase/phosphomutase